MARTLGQVAGVMPRLRQKDNDIGSELKRRIQTESQTQGHTRTLKLDDPDAPIREPDKHVRVALTAEEALEEASKHAIEALDITATSDRTSQEASADVIVDGKVLLEKVPVSHLLWLRNYLGQWRGFIEALPILNPTREWHADTARKGLHKTDPEVVSRTDKAMQALLLHGGNEKFKPEAQAVPVEKTVGKYTTVHMSGAVTENRRKQLIGNVDKLHAAVEDAKARANHTPAIEVKEGAKIMGILLG